MNETDTLQVTVCFTHVLNKVLDDSLYTALQNIAEDDHRQLQDN